MLSHHGNAYATVGAGSVAAAPWLAFRTLYDNCKKIILDGKAKIQGVCKLNQSPNERPTEEKEAKSFGVRMTL